MATTNCDTQIKSKSASASVREMDLGKPRKAVRERIPHKNWEKWKKRGMTIRPPPPTTLHTTIQQGKLLTEHQSEKDLGNGEIGRGRVS